MASYLLSFDKFFLVGKYFIVHCLADYVIYLQLKVFGVILNVR